jgi:hypothetical protein
MKNWIYLTKSKISINKGLLAKEIWKYDNEKNDLANLKGYQVLVIWESECTKTPKDVINKCIKFLYD